jgi:predicted nucleic acid-binding protein
VKFVLDTNLVSEIRKPRPDAKVLSWFSAQDPATLFITTVSLAEFWQGLHSLPTSHRDYSMIRNFVRDLPRQFRVLNFDTRAAERWGKLIADAKGPLPLRDSLIAAIALSRGHSIATRDVDPFLRSDCKVVNPWSL